MADGEAQRPAMTNGVYSSSDATGPIVVALSCGWMTLPASFFLAGEHGQVRAPATSFLIDHPHGLALFDTGFGPRVFDGLDVSLASVIATEPEDRIDRRLQEIGIDPGSIRWIINSHLHVDHAGGNQWLPDATVVMQANEWEYARHSDDRAYHPSEVETGHKRLLVHGEHDLYGDGSVILFPTAGHTPGHQSVRVRTTTGAVVLTGDCCNLRRSLDEMRLPAQVHDAAAYRASLELLARQRSGGDRILFAHDAGQWATLPKGVALDAQSLF